MVEGETTIQFPGTRDMEYWGGFFDVSLHFDITKHRADYTVPGSHQKVDNVIYHPFIAVFSSDRESLSSLQEVVPGNIYSRYKKVPEGKYQSWGLVLRKQVTCYRFLRSIIPVLDYKREQAEIMEDFLRQKREVIREVEGLWRVPLLYNTPEDRIIAEEGFRQRLLTAKTTEVVKDPHLPNPGRLSGIADAKIYLGIYDTERVGRGIEFGAYAGLHSAQIGLLTGIYERYHGAKPVRRSERKDRYKGPTYHWQLSGDGMIEFLEDVEPGMVFQGTKVRVILDFLRVREVFNRFNFYDDPIVAALRTKVLTNYLDQWQELNKKAD